MQPSVYGVRIEVLFVLVIRLSLALTQSVDANTNPCCNGTNFVSGLFCEDDNEQFEHLLLNCEIDGSPNEIVVFDPVNPLENFTIDENGLLHISQLHTFFGDEANIIQPNG